MANYNMDDIVEVKKREKRKNLLELQYRDELIDKMRNGKTINLTITAVDAGETSIIITNSINSEKITIKVTVEPPWKDVEIVIPENLPENLPENERGEDEIVFELNKVMEDVGKIVIQKSEESTENVEIELKTETDNVKVIMESE